MKGEPAHLAVAAAGPPLDPALQAVGRDAASKQIAGGGMGPVGGAVVTRRPAGPPEPYAQGEPGR